MKAKEYLQKIFFLESKINSDRERVRTYKELAVNKVSKLTPDKIQSTSSKQKMADAVCVYSDIEKTIKADEKKKQEIIDTISRLTPYESIVLYKCYVDRLTLKQTAKVICRSYSWVSKKHHDGLNSIQKILDERENAGD